MDCRQGLKRLSGSSPGRTAQHRMARVGHHKELVRGLRKGAWQTLTEPQLDDLSKALRISNLDQLTGLGVLPIRLQLRRTGRDAKDALD